MLCSITVGTPPRSLRLLRAKYWPPISPCPPAPLLQKKISPGSLLRLPRWVWDDVGNLCSNVRLDPQCEPLRGGGSEIFGGLGWGQGLPSRGNRIDMSQAQARRGEVGWWGRRVYLYRERRRKCVKKYWGPGCSITRGSFRCLDITFVVREVGIDIF